MARPDGPAAPARHKTAGTTVSTAPIESVPAPPPEERTPATPAARD
jgi:hypothetical protein